MPISNLGFKHLTAAQITELDTHLTAIETIVASITQNLSEQERKKFGSVNEQNKLLVNKCNDYHINQSSLQSPDVDWAEFDKDFTDRTVADTRLNRITNIERMLSDFKIVHDYDNYQAALTDYEYSQYKANSNAPGFTEKVADLKQFFPRTGTGGSSDESTDIPKP
jgi:hypothetical protein